MFSNVVIFYYGQPSIIDTCPTGDHITWDITRAQLAQNALLSPTCLGLWEIYFTFMSSGDLRVPNDLREAEPY